MDKQGERAEAARGICADSEAGVGSGRVGEVAVGPGGVPPDPVQSVVT